MAHGLLAYADEKWEGKMPLVWTGFDSSGAETSPSVNNPPAEISAAAGSVTGSDGHRTIKAKVKASRTNADGRTHAVSKIPFKENFEVNSSDPNPKIVGEFVYKVTEGSVSANDSTTTAASAELACEIRFLAHSAEDDSVLLFDERKRFRLRADGTWYATETDEVPAGDRVDVKDLGPFTVNNGDRYVLRGSVRIDDLECRVSQDPENLSDPVDGFAKGAFNVSKARVFLWLE